MLKKNDFVVVIDDERYGGNVGKVVKEHCFGSDVDLIVDGNIESTFLINEKLKQITNKEMFNEIINIALDYEIPYIYAVLKMDKSDDVDVIVTPFTNFENRMEYYNENFDDELHHKKENVRIIEFGTESSMCGIESTIYN